MTTLQRFLLLISCIYAICHDLHATRIMRLPLTLQFDKQKLSKSSVHDHGKIVVCMFDPWSYFRHPSGSFQISDIDPTLCSQLVYRNAGIDNSTYRVKIRDEHLAINMGWIKKSVALSQAHPHLKVLLSVGGWNEGSWTFSKIAADFNLRNIFVESVLRVLSDYGFHGLDLAWEYPAWETRGGIPDDKKNLPLLLNDLKNALDKKYILSLTVAGDVIFHAQPAYDVNAIGKLVDQITVRSFDFSGGWSSKAYHHSALIDRLPHQSVTSTVNFYLEGGIPPEKLIMGIPLYGRTFRLENEPSIYEQDLMLVSGLEQPTKGSFSGAWIPDDLTLGYHEICYNLTNTDNWQTYWDNTCLVPFARSGKRWVSFDNPESIESKVNFTIEKKLKGVMAWTIDTDDFTGTACKRATHEDENQETLVKYPLLRTINYGLYLGTGTGDENVDNKGRSESDVVSPGKKENSPGGPVNKKKDSFSNSNTFYKQDMTFYTVIIAWLTLHM